jgi:hypothetical protein
LKTTTMMKMPMTILTSMASTTTNPLRRKKPSPACPPVFRLP